MQTISKFKSLKNSLKCFSSRNTVPAVDTKKTIETMSSGVKDNDNTVK